MNGSEAVWELAHKYVEGAITREECRELADQLRRDADFRRTFVEYLGVDAALAEFSPSGISPIEDHKANSPHDETSVLLPSRSNWKTRTALAMATAAGLLGMLSIWKPWDGSLPSARQAIVVAYEAAEGLKPANFVPQQTIDLEDVKLESGLLRLRIPKAAELELVGPMQLEWVAPLHLRVVYGRLTARNCIEGFSIDTPQSRIVDLGTDFGIDVSSAGQESVVVFDGAVELQRHDTSKPNQTRLEAGQGVSIEGGNEYPIATIFSSAKNGAWSPRVDEHNTSVITSVRDNISQKEVKWFYHVIPQGMMAGAPAWRQPSFRWYPFEEESFPKMLEGADLVRMVQISEVRLAAELNILVTLRRDAELFILQDLRHEAPAWLTKDFEPTDAKLALQAFAIDDRPWQEWEKTDAKALPFAVWKKYVAAGEIRLGPARTDDHRDWSFVYGIAARAAVN